LAASCSTRSFRSAVDSGVLMTSGSASVVAMVLRGFSDAKGFWNTICTSRRSALVSAVAVSTPRIFSEPLVGVSISVSWRASVLLPQPDSPTTASVFLGASVKLTPLSAFTVALGRNRPRLTL